MAGSLPGYVSADDVPITIPRVPAREAAERELLKPVYHQDDPNIIQRAITWFWDRVDALLNAATGVSPGGWVGLTVIACIVLLAILALRLRLGRLRHPTSAAPPVFDARPRTAAEHRAAAESHAAQQRWSQAIPERMRALVCELEERALLEPRPGRTADEAAEEAAYSLPAHKARLRAAALSFDDVRYGDHIATEQAYQQLADLDTELSRSKPALAAGTGGVTR